MSLSQDILFEAQPYLIANEKHPFVQGIIKGQLSPDQLRYYDEQDIAFEYNEVAVINALINCSTTTDQVLLFHKRRTCSCTCWMTGSNGNRNRCPTTGNH